MSQSESVESLAAAAHAAANAGRWQDAEALWDRVIKHAPDHAQAHYALAVHAMQRRDFTRAAQMLERACVLSPRDAMARLTLAVARREQGDAQRELSEIDAALTIDSYFVPGLLSKARWYERERKATTAAFYFAAALKASPPEPNWPMGLRDELLHARKVADQHAAAFDARLLEATVDVRGKLPAAEAERWREAASVMAGRSTPYVQHCARLHVPRLPPIPFYDTAQFPWLAEVEGATDAIRSELLKALETRKEEFRPYVTNKPGMPLNQWSELDHSDRWSAFQLWRNGAPVTENLALCPVTAKVLENVGMAEIAGLCPNAMFSTLAPHTQIPPHTGETNARIVAHLPLIVPDRCLYRVGFEQRRWEVGKVLVFDDTIEHEARNDSDELRVVLIFDVWNPYLSKAEQDVVRTMMQTARSFGGVTEGSPA